MKVKCTLVVSFSHDMILMWKFEELVYILVMVEQWCDQRGSGKWAINKYE